MKRSEKLTITRLKECCVGCVSELGERICGELLLLDRWIRLLRRRQLKDKGVEVCFEKENIYTKGELLITIVSSLAQEESRSISENVSWGIRKRFADGKSVLPDKCFLGYEKGDNGKPKIVESEAKVVRLICDRG